jgi:hypothetical protein
MEKWREFMMIETWRFFLVVDVIYESMTISCETLHPHNPNISHRISKKCKLEIFFRTISTFISASYKRDVIERCETCKTRQYLLHVLFLLLSPLLFSYNRLMLLCRSVVKKERRVKWTEEDDGKLNNKSLPCCHTEYFYCFILHKYIHFA